MNFSKNVGILKLQEVAHPYEVGSEISHEKSQFQDIEVFKSKRSEFVMLIDGAIQSTEMDEFAYHEIYIIIYRYNLYSNFYINIIYIE